jgi:hypothetical protein
MDAEAIRVRAQAAAEDLFHRMAALGQLPTSATVP